MTAPAVAAGRFGWAFLMGLGLGAVYGFLRPLRPRRTVLADLIFLAAAVWAWLQLGFGVCRGDLRLGYLGGLIAGGLVWEWTAGRLLRPVFRGIWKGIGKLWGALTWPGKKISQFAKILFASGEKWVTIKWRNRRHFRLTSGGSPNGRNKRFFKTDQAGSPPQQQSEQDRGDRYHRIVYGSSGHSAPGYEQN